MNKTGNTKMELLSKAPIPKALLALGLPTMVGMLINALYNLVDSYFVGRLGTDMMDAITVAYPLGQVIVGLGLLFGNGAASYLSRLLGKGDRKTANKAASTAIYSSIIIGVIVIAISIVFLKPILRQLGAPENVMHYAMSYTGIYIGFSIFNIFNVTMNNIVSSEGNSKIAMIALMSGAVLNVILDPLFIYTFKWGIVGAAIATASSQIVTSIIYIIYILRKKSIFSFSIKDYTIKSYVMSEILKIGIPTLIFQILTSLSISMINNSISQYSGSALAAMNPVTKIMSMGSLIVFGFLKGFQPIAGYSYGAKNIDRLKKAIKTSIIWSTIFCVIFGLILILLSENIMSQFTIDDLEMIRVGKIALRSNGLSFALFGFYTVYSFLFLVMGKAKSGLFLGACRQGICFIPIILLLPKCIGLNGILFSQPIADVASAIVTVFMAISLHRDLKKLEILSKHS